MGDLWIGCSCWQCFARGVRPRKVTMTNPTNSNTDSATNPLEPLGILDAAVELWATYAAERADAHLSCVAERNALADVMAKVLAQHALALEHLDPHHNAGKFAAAEVLKLQTNTALSQIHALHEKDRQQAFLDGFAMGCAFLAGAAKAKQDHDAFGGKAGA